MGNGTRWRIIFHQPLGHTAFAGPVFATSGCYLKYNDAALSHQAFCTDASHMSKHLIRFAMPRSRNSVAKDTRPPLCGTVLLCKGPLLHVEITLQLGCPLANCAAHTWSSSFVLEPFLSLLTGLAKLTCRCSPASSRIALECLIAEERLPSEGRRGFPPKLR